MKIYKITHIESGKIYIGQTVKTSHKRWLKHCADAENGKIGTLIARAILKYGRKSFIVEDISSVLSEEYLDEVEIICIKQFNSMMPYGYNMLRGGGKSYQKNRTESQRRKISQIQTGRKASLSTRLKMSKAAKERTLNQGLSEAQKASLLKGRDSLKGREPWNKGITVTNKSTLKAQSESHIGQVACNKKSIICIETGQEFDSLHAAAKALKLQVGHVCSVLKGKRKSTGGFTFKYK